MKTITRIALILAAALSLTACMQDEGVYFAERDIAYSVVPDADINYVIYNPPTLQTKAHVATEREYMTLLERFCSWAEEGAVVTFCNAQASPWHAAKEGGVAAQPEEYTTTDREEMKRWMAQMEEAGKTVTVSYDRETKTWRGVAYIVAPKPEPLPDTLPQAPTIDSIRSRVAVPDKYPVERQ